MGEKRRVDMGESSDTTGVWAAPTPPEQAALRSLVEAYAAAADERDAAAFVELFDDAATLQVIEADGNRVPPFSGAGLATALAPLAEYEATMHLIANHQCYIDENRATGVVYCQAQHLRRRDDGRLENLHMVIRYEDNYIRTTFGWKFAERVCRILWIELHAAALDATVY